jgi:RNA polymerase sigma factor (sigma-70 family)
VDDSSRQLFDRWLAGDSQAPGEIVDRYAALLFTIVMDRLSRGLARRLHPSDVLQSIWKDVFTGARTKSYKIEKPGDLRALLCEFARNKVKNKIRYLNQQKRLYTQEVLSDPVETLADCPEQRLSPEHVVELADEVEHVLGRLTPDQRQIVQWMLQDRSTTEIAAELKCADRTVRRKLEQIRQCLAATADSEAGTACAAVAPPPGADP